MNLMRVEVKRYFIKKTEKLTLLPKTKYLKKTKDKDKTVKKYKYKAIGNTAFYVIHVIII
jgi:hypothetical protein